MIPQSKQALIAIKSKVPACPAVLFCEAADTVDDWEADYDHVDDEA